MRIDAIAIENFLSFDTLTWQSIDPHLNVIVGPNGVGKTNLFHALRAVRDIVGSTARAAEPDKSEWAWEAVDHRGNKRRSIRIVIDVTLTTAEERELLSVFMVCAFYRPSEIQHVYSNEHQRYPDFEGLGRFVQWLEDQMPHAITWLNSGRLVIESKDGGRRWNCLYQSRSDASPFWWDFQSPGIRSQAQPTGGSTSSLFASWRKSLSDEDREKLDLALLGEDRGDMPKQLDLTGMASWEQGRLDKPLSISEFIGASEVPAIYQRLGQLVAQSPSQFHISGSQLWCRILDPAMVFTQNIRQFPQRMYSLEHLRHGSLELSGGRDIAPFLYRKKLGDTEQRAEYRRIQENFTRLTGRKFEVRDESAGFAQTESNAYLTLIVDNGWGDVPLAFSGAGITEALFLSAVMTDRAGQVILLDEPGLNLHPTMMTTFISTFLAQSDQDATQLNQFMMVTHAPGLIPPDAIDRVRRFSLRDGHTVKNQLEISALASETLADLRTMLRGNVALRSLLLSRGVILVEGETELGALPLWGELAPQDIALHSVGGKGEFTRVVRLLHHFGIPWAVLCDGDALWDRRQKGKHSGDLHVQPILKASGKASPPVVGDPGHSIEDFLSWRQCLEPLGIFSLAQSPDQGFEKAIQTEVPEALWRVAHEHFNSNKVAVGRYIAEHHHCPESVRVVLQQMLKHLQDRGAAT